MAVFTGQPGNDLFAGTDGVADRFLFSPANLSASDVVTGGNGTVNDTLEITAAGAITSTQLAGVSGIEFIKLVAGVSIDISDDLVASSRLRLITVFGTAGNDAVYGGDIIDGANKLSFNAGAGNDLFVGGAGADTISIGAADLTSRDFFSGGGGVNGLTLSSAGSVAVTGFNNVFGFKNIFLNAGGNDITLGQGTVGSNAGGVVAIVGGNGADSVNATAVDAGRIIFSAGHGANTFFGTTGSDKATGGGDDDHFEGGGGNDVLDGGIGDNTLFGGSGNDTITASVGTSVISGGAGKDIITTYTNDQLIDTLVYSAPSEGGDTIRGDLLNRIGGAEIVFQFDDAAFSTLGSDFNSVVFDDGTNSAAANGADLVLYNDGSGTGLGSAAAVDAYFHSNYLISPVTGAFLLDYNSTTGEAVLYYDSNASTIGTGGVTVIATVMGLGSAIAASELVSHFVMA